LSTYNPFDTGDIMQNSALHPNDPALTDLLSPEELDALGRISTGVMKIKDAVERLNEFAGLSGLPLRPIPYFPLFLVTNDISRLMHAHQLAENRIRTAAFDAVTNEVAP
jgi:hypothetical protein